MEEDGEGGENDTPRTQSEPTQLSNAEQSLARESKDRSAQEQGGHDDPSGDRVCLAESKPRGRLGRDLAGTPD